MLWFFDENGVIQLTGAGLVAIPCLTYLVLSFVNIAIHSVKRKKEAFQQEFMDLMEE